MARLTFDQETHSYQLDGRPLPSVTRILKPLYDFSHVNPDVLRAAADFGTNVHAMAALYLQGALDESTLDENLRGPLEALKAWEADNAGLFVDEPVIETPLAYARLEYAGTPDIIFDGVAVIDIKTREYNPATDPLQIAAYEKLWTANGGKIAKYEHRVLVLRPDGTYTYQNAYNPEAWGVFRVMLEMNTCKRVVEKWKANAR